MNDLELRYRRLLKLYPRSFRAEHGHEMLTVLMACAPEGQRRPEAREAANLIRSALWMRLRRNAAWELTHRPRLWLMVRLLSGMWLAILTVVLCGFGRWWGLALVPVAVLHFYRAYRIGLAIEAQGGGGPPPLTRA